MLEPSRAIVVTCSGEGVPVARLHALLRLLYPDEMTPTAKRMFEQVIAEHQLAK